jgi:peptidoglycan hydrolase CwlO-like protein
MNLDRILELERVETEPIEREIQASSVLILNITRELDSMKHEEEQVLPQQQHELTEQQDSINSMILGEKEKLKNLTTEGARHLSLLQASIDEGKEDLRIVTKLLDWVIKEIKNKHIKHENLVFISTTFSKLKSQLPSIQPLLMQIRESVSDAVAAAHDRKYSDNDSLSAEDVQTLVTDAIKEISANNNNLEQQKITYTHNLSVEKEALETKIREQEVTYTEISNRVSALQTRRSDLRGLILSAEMKRDELQTDIQTLTQRKHEIELSYQDEKAQLTEIENSILSILEMIRLVS